MKNFCVGILNEDMHKFNRVKDLIMKKVDEKTAGFDQEVMKDLKEGIAGIIISNLNNKSLYGFADITNDEIDTFMGSTIISNEGYSVSFRDENKALDKNYTLDEQGNMIGYKSTMFRGAKQGDFIDIRRTDEGCLTLQVGYNNGSAISMTRALPCSPEVKLDTPASLGYEVNNAIRNLLTTNDINAFESKMHKIQENAFIAQKEYQNKDEEER